MNKEIHLRDIPDYLRNKVPGVKEAHHNMPYAWSNVDTRNAILSSLLPAGVALVGAGAIGSSRHLHAFNKGTRTPNWAIRDPRVLAAIDFAVITPLGYASYLVYKNGGGFDYTDTSVALGLYGINLLSTLAAPAAFKNGNTKWIAINAGLVHATALATACAFSKIDKCAGYWLIPYAIWTGYYAVLAFYFHNKNTENLH